MIEGNFTDVSLPAMLQLLCMETQKSFRVGVAFESQRGEIYVRRGWVIAAMYGILEGEDAFCEFMSWREGVFWAEQVTAQMEMDKNLSFAFQPNSAFVQDCAYLAQIGAGLNSQITGSILYGSTAWKEAVRDNPLDRDTLSVLAWLREGRTTHQAMREFGFDIVKAASILARLLLTRSVDVVRPSLVEEAPAADEGLGHMKVITTGGQEAAAAKLAQEAAKALESAGSVAQEAFLSTSFKSPAAAESYSRQSDTNPNLPKVQTSFSDAAQARSSMEARLRAKRGGTTGSNFPAYVEKEVNDLSADTDTDTGEIDALGGDNKETVVFQSVSSPVVPETAPEPSAAPSAKPKVVPTSDIWLDDQPPTRSSGLQALLKNALEKSKQIAAERIGSSEVDTSDALPVLRDSPTVIEARDESAPGADDKQGLAGGGAAEAETKPERLSGADAAQENEVISFVPPPAEGTPPEEGPADPAQAEDLPADDPRFTSRTVALPLVALDIERLLQATFTATQFGKLALGNPSLDQHRRQTLLDAEQGKPLSHSLEDGSRPAAAVLSSYRYCLDRGYIDTQDPVIPLTADLLLGRMEIDQYLLQRRRITGDQLRDLIKVARQEGVKLPQLLMRSGFLTAGDIETLDREQKRFAFK